MHSYTTALAFLTVLALPLAAQEPQCATGTTAQARAACNTMVDATKASIRSRG